MTASARKVAEVAQTRESIARKVAEVAQTRESLATKVAGLEQPRKSIATKVAGLEEAPESKNLDTQKKLKKVILANKIRGEIDIRCIVFESNFLRFSKNLCL